MVVIDLLIIIDFYQKGSDGSVEILDNDELKIFKEEFPQNWS